MDGRAFEGRGLVDQYLVDRRKERQIAGAERAASGVFRRFTSADGAAGHEPDDPRTVGIAPDVLLVETVDERQVLLRRLERRVGRAERERRGITARPTDDASSGRCPVGPDAGVGHVEDEKALGNDALPEGLALEGA